MAAALLLACAVAAALVAWVWALQVADERQAAATRLQLHAAALGAELLRHEALPEVLALDARLAAALAAPQDPARLAEANQYLASSQQRTGAEALFLIDRQGRTLAASNHAGADSFVGQNYAYRPYVQQALAGQLGRFYAVGATTGRPGYFLAAPVAAGSASAAVAGVVAVKVSLDSFEATLKPGGGITLLTDSAGVALLSSEPRWRYRTLAALPAEARGAIDRTQQYTGQVLQPLVLGLDLRQLDTLPRGVPEPALAGLRQVVRQPVGTPAAMGWQLLAFVDTPQARRTAALAGTASLLAGVGGVLGWQVLRLRRRRRRELLAMEDQIRARIAHSTQHLQQQLAEQARTESLLRQTTDAAVQAGKLAVLGQMAAGISHELNQPLTAMCGYAENALTMMDSGEHAGVRNNLVRIGSLSERMGQIVSHLRAHARKQPEPVGPVPVQPAVDSTLQLLRTPHGGVPRVLLHIQPPGLAVHAQPVRLEQVLLNLLRNALQASPDGQPPEVSARAEGTQVLIAVRDHGAGLGPEVLPRLFEPFFTTRPGGQGLGLGLAVSRMIVQGLGGSLQAGNAEGGGAEFVVRLPLAQTGANDAG